MPAFAISGSTTGPRFCQRASRRCVCRNPTGRNKGVPLPPLERKSPFIRLGFAPRVVFNYMIIIKLPHRWRLANGARTTAFFVTFRHFSHSFARF